jgi:hypothetical protein
MLRLGPALTNISGWSLPSGQRKYSRLLACAVIQVMQLWLPISVGHIRSMMLHSKPKLSQHLFPKPSQINYWVNYRLRCMRQLKPAGNQPSGSQFTLHSRRQREIRWHSLSILTTCGTKGSPVTLIARDSKKTADVIDP